MTDTKTQVQTAPVPTVGDLAREVEVALAQVEAAAKKESAARSEHINARNRYDEATRKFDDAVAQMKKKAPRDTGWSR